MCCLGCRWNSGLLLMAYSSSQARRTAVNWGVFFPWQKSEACRGVRGCKWWLLRPVLETATLSFSSYSPTHSKSYIFKPIVMGWGRNLKNNLICQYEGVSISYQMLWGRGDYKLASIGYRFGDLNPYFQVIKFNELVSIGFLKVLHTDGN